MVGGFPRKEGMERKDMMKKNVSIYKAQASALEQHAAPNCKVRFAYLKSSGLLVHCFSIPDDEHMVGSYIIQN